MAELTIEQDRAVIRLGRGNALAAAVAIGVFLAIGLAIDVIFLRVWAAAGFDPELAGSLFNPENELGVFGLVWLFLGLASTFIPCLAVISLLSGRKKPRTPQTLVFDNLARRFTVSTRPWNAADYALTGDSLPAYGYGQLDGFVTRRYTTSSSSGSGSRSTTHHVVCLRKSDGGLWDLHDTTSKDSADDFLARLREAVRFDQGKRDPEACPPLPPGIIRLPAGGSTLFCWSNPSHFLGLALGLAFLSAMGWLTARIAAGALPFLIFAGIVMGLIALVMLKGIWEGMLSLRRFQCLRLSGDRIQVGRLPKHLLRGAGGQDPAHFVADPQAIEAAFKSRQQLDIRDVRRVQYSWRAGDRSPAAQELRLMGESAARESDQLQEAVSEGKVMKSLSLMRSASLREGTMAIRLEGLSVGETMAFERVLEQEIARRGGSAV